MRIKFQADGVVDANVYNNLGGYHQLRNALEYKTTSLKGFDIKTGKGSSVLPNQMFGGLQTGDIVLMKRKSRNFYVVVTFSTQNFHCKEVEYEFLCFEDEYYDRMLEAVMVELRGEDKAVMFDRLYSITESVADTFELISDEILYEIRFKNNRKSLEFYHKQEIYD